MSAGARCACRCASGVCGNAGWLALHPFVAQLDKQAPWWPTRPGGKSELATEQCSAAFTLVSRLPSTAA